MAVAAVWYPDNHLRDAAEFLDREAARKSEAYIGTVPAGYQIMK